MMTRSPIVPPAPIPRNPQPLVHWLDTTPVDSTDKPCTIDDLEVKARVSGLYAKVDVTIRLANPNGRPISTDVSFSMPEGGTVCGYALEIDGQMIDGVVVPKETARVAFETERRRGVDPGMAEAVRGNIYKTSVYPVPPNGTRKTRLSYVAPLSVDNGSSATIVLPIPSDEVTHQSIRIEVESPECPQPVITGLDGGTTQGERGFWTFDCEGQATSATEPIRITLPDLPSPLVTVEKDESGDVWFSASEAIPEQTADDMVLPSIKTLTILWDASGSRAAQDHNAEIELVCQYASDEGIDDICLVTFADEIRLVSQPKTAKELSTLLGDIRYDGGTNLHALGSFLTSTKAPTGLAAEGLCLLFSDGLDTLSGNSLTLPSECDMLAIVSGTQRDYEGLRQMCRGHAFDLRHAPKDAHALMAEFSPSMSARRLAVNGTGVLEVCDAGLMGSGRRCAIGRLVSDAALIRLGDGGQDIAVKSDGAGVATVLPQAWAARRVTLLSPRANDNAEELESIGRRFGVASPVTSLLVLETLDQWLRYDICPPKSWESMWQEWQRLQEGRMQLSSDEADRNRHLAAVEREWEGLVKWHETNFDEVAPEPEPEPRQVILGSRGIPAMRQRLSNAVDAIHEAADLRRRMFVRGEHSRMHMESVTYESATESVAYESTDDLVFADSADSWDDTAVSRQAMAGGATLDSMDMGIAPMADGETSLFMMAADVVTEDAGSAVPDMASATPSTPEAKLSIQPWTPDTPYLSELDKTFEADGIEAAVDTYHSLRPEYASSPSFFLDCASWFVTHEDTDFGLSVLSNLAEMDVDNPALLRVLGWRLREAGRLSDATVILRKVLALRGEDAQSYRDLALVLSEQAKEHMGQGLISEAKAAAEEACDHYRTIAITPWNRRAVALSLFAVEEMNVLREWVSRQDWKDVEAPDIPPVSEKLEGILDCDLRITMAWDADDTDIDIHVTEPSGEEAYYGHRLTSSGGRVSEDITDGFGPELYEIHKSRKGTYVIRAHYYASHQQTVFGPATCTLTIYTDWGRPTQGQTITTTRLDKAKAMVPVGTASYGVPVPETTAEKDSAKGRKRLATGMSEDEVAELLGEPASWEDQDGMRILCWDMDGGRRLVVTFADGCLVKAIEAMPWGDEMVIAQ